MRTVEIPLVGLPQPLDGFSLVQLSDLHIGLVLKRAWLKEVVAKTNNLDADLVVLTGDMIDGTPQALGDEIAPLADLRARHGVYGITGNHEYYFGAQQWTATFSSLGVTMLHNQYRRFPIQGHDLILAGVPDPAARHFNDSGPDRTFLQTLPQGTRILLQHRPSGTPDTYGIDLQLSGHTHGGHLLFLKWLIGSYNGGLIDGLFDLNGSKLYVSPGTGVWAGFSCRLGVPSEITRIILRRQEHEQITQRQESHSHTNTDATRVVHLRP